MTISKFIYSLLLALLCWATAGHAAVVTKLVPLQGEETPGPSKLPAADTQKVDQKVDAKKAEARWQWVGLRRRGAVSCPPVEGWEVHDWIQQALSTPRQRTGEEYYRKTQEQDFRRAAEDYRLLQNLGLDRLCVYRATGKDLDFDKHLPTGLVAAKPDRMALAPSADRALGPAGRITWSTLADHLLLQTGKKSETGQDLLPRPNRVDIKDVQQEKGVRLVFLDTQPDGEGVPASPPVGLGRSDHGYTLAHLAQNLVCSEPGVPRYCVATIATRLALPYPEFDRDRPPAESLADSSGGSLGLVNELAQTIVRVVWDWRQSGDWRPPESRKHLILNLSLGWDGELFRDLSARRASQLDPAVRAVYDALRFARREGVLVIAAAGNQRGGKPSNWPLLPAAWELRRPSWFHFVFGPKRVYAVGGIDSQGLPLANSRDGGRPRRTAYGDHAVASTADPKEPTAIYTGTSVSAAVTSSIAAVVWHLRPELSPAEVMKLLDRAGNDLPSRADFHAWKNFWPLSSWPQFSSILAPQTTRLSLCSAVKEACGADGSLCHLAQRPSADCQWQPKAADLSPLIPPDTYVPIILTEENPPLHDPMGQWPDMPSRRWLVPTPEDNPCPGCSIVPPSRVNAHNALASLSGLLEGVPPEPRPYSREHVLALEINPKWVQGTYFFTSAVLKVVHYSAGRPDSTSTYNIPTDVLNTRGPSTIFYYTVVGEPGPFSACTATVDFEVFREGRSYSFQSPVYVDP